MPRQKRTQSSQQDHDIQMRTDERRLQSGHADHYVLAPAFRDLKLPISRFDVATRLFEGLVRRKQSPWLVIVVRFSDDKNPVAKKYVQLSDPLAPYKRVFTAEGRGELNVVDFFQDMSHGVLDLSKSTVVGPYRLPRPRADYVGNVYPQPEGKLNRNGILELAKATAVEKGIDPSTFAGVVVCGTPTLDLCGWLGGMAALCDDLSLTPSLLGQELGHGYGLDHSRRHGSTDDYADPWDTMSTASDYSAPHAEFGSVGPGLNAWNMRLRGWLDEDRVVSVEPGAQAIVTLKPLHDWPFGTIALEAHGFLIEFRARERWDRNIPRPCVMIHRVDGNQSYMMASTAGNFDLVQGDRFEWGLPVGRSLDIEVLDIDNGNRSATVKVVHRMIRIPEYVEWSPRDYLNPLPPVASKPDLRTLVDRYQAVVEVAQRYGRPEIQLEALGDIAEQIGRMASKIELTTMHPGYSYSEAGQRDRHRALGHGIRASKKKSAQVKPKRPAAKRKGKANGVPTR